MSTSRLGLVGRVTLALLAIVAVSGMFVAVAQAAGPQWTIEEGKVKKTLTTHTESRNIKSITKLGASPFVLKSSGLTVECKKIELGAGGGTIAGGNPGTDKAEIVFSECNVEGFKECKAEEAGTGHIVTKVLTMLSFENPKVANMALDAYFPESSTNEFAKFKLVGTAAHCPAGAANLTVTVTATGTSIAIPELSATRKCGVLAEVGKSSGTAWELIANKELFPKGGQNFPSTAKTAGTYWNGTSFETFTCGLDVALGSNHFTPTEIGEAEIDLAAGVEGFGWE